MNRFFLIFLVVSTQFLSFGQTKIEEYKKKQQQGIDELQNKSQQYIQQKDKEFEEFLKSEWVNFSLITGERYFEEPKPKELPHFNILQERNETLISYISPIDKTRLTNKSEADTVFGPVKPKRFPSSASRDEPSFFWFYGIKTMVPTGIFKCPDISYRSGVITFSKWWKDASDSESQDLMEHLWFYKNELSLNDWGYLKLVQAYARKMCPDEVNSVLFTWFCLNKTGYDIRLAYNDEKLSILIPVVQQLYDLSYISLSGRNYYIMNDLGTNKIKTYKKGYSEANKIMDFDLNKPFEIGDSAVSRTFTFDFNLKTYTFNLNYNPFWTWFYSDYPNGDLTIYFEAVVSPQLKMSIHQNLEPIIDKMNEHEAANFLLSFVQFGFDYKRDDDQFGREKTFFPEETLFYPYADCEDRAVFYSFLVKELLGNDIIGLQYKNHIATAISIKSIIKGDYLLYNGKRFYVADPSFIGASIGNSMTEYAHSNPKILNID